MASKGAKKLISKKLIDRIHSKGGRFLQPLKVQEKPPIYRYVEVVDNAVLLKKASQTLRETNALAVKEVRPKKTSPMDPRLDS